MTSDAPLTRSDETSLFLGDDKAALYGKLMTIGGGLLFVGAILLGAVLVMLPPDLDPGPGAMTLVTTGPIIAGLALISLGLMQWRAPQQVDVGPDGVTVHTDFGEKHILWTDVVALQTGERNATLGYVTYKTVKLLGLNKKVLLELNSQIKPFDDLVTRLWERASVGRELEVTDTAARKRRGEAWFLIILGPLFAALGLWGGIMSSRELQQKNALQDHPATAVATITKHYKFNVTPRVEYTFRDAAGVEHQRGTIVAENIWNKLREGHSVPIRYLPDDPDYSRLAVGDLHDKQSHDPQLMVFAGPFVALLGVFFFVCGALQFCGIDVDKLLGIKAKKKSKA